MTEEWKQYVIEVAWSIINQPQGSLWNYGTRPTARQEAEFKGRKEAAQEILDAILSEPKPPIQMEKR